MLWNSVGPVVVSEAAGQDFEELCGGIRILNSDTSAQTSFLLCINLLLSSVVGHEAH